MMKTEDLQFAKVERDLTITTSYNEEDVMSKGAEKSHCGRKPIQLSSGKHYKDKITGSIFLEPGETVPGTGFRVKCHKELITSMSVTSATERVSKRIIREECLGELPSFAEKVNLTARDILRWQMAWSAVVRRQKFHQKSKLKYGNPLIRRSDNWPHLEDILHRLSIALGFSVTAIIYGGLHALAWFAHFNSATEKSLWRMSACMVMSGFPIIFILAKFAILKYRTKKEDVEMAVELYVGSLAVFLASWTSLAYAVARAYLVAECFVQISHLPAEVYDFPSWSFYIPHIS